MENQSFQQIPDNSEGEVAGFIAKTFEILNNDEYFKIIHWGTTGKEFVIKDINKFQQIVLPQYFRHKKINSFVRQLNMYGFHKSRKDNSKCIFSHPSFLKGRQDLLASIKRKIRSVEPPIKTPIKETQTCNGSKVLEDTCIKQQPKQTKKIILEDPVPILTGFLESRNCLNSFVNLNMSLRKLSANNFDVLEQKQDDQISIAQNIAQHERQTKEKGPTILNPSFFFCSFNEFN